MIQARLLSAVPLARVLSWRPLLASIVPAAGVVVYVARDRHADATEAALALRAAALSLAVGLAFLLDDPSEELTAPTPVSTLARRLVRVGLALPLVVAAWLVLVPVANSASGLERPLPTGATLLELASLGAVALGGAAVGSRRLADRLGGPAGAATVVLFAVAACVLPWGGPLALRLPNTALYEAGLWRAALALGAVAFVSASTVRWRPGRRSEPHAEAARMTTVGHAPWGRRRDRDEPTP